VNYTKGSSWHKWDLHVHTPYSIEHQYTCKEEEDIWEKFISNLENLPPEFKVIGINDYIFIEGYQKVLEYKNNGRLKNLDLILPVIEIRLDKFGGSKNNISRVNYHIIFSEEIDPQTINHQFLFGLSSKYQLSPMAEEINLQWNYVPTKESLEELGRLIKSSVPEDKLPFYGSDLKEGFNNLNFNLGNVQKVLDKACFRDKYITAVGKTEWADIKWNDQSIADKKNIINGADLVFISSTDTDHFQIAKEKLTEEKVNNLLLDCSDAHRFSDSDDKDRIGNCLTWLKCDTTFRGLNQIIHEPESRIFIGDIPPKMEMVNKNPSKFIHSIAIKKNENSTLEGWFDSEIPLNHDLIAVIGNKGNGKSAFADIVGLLGATKNHNDFSFLTKDRFRMKGLSENYKGEIVWEGGRSETKPLHLNPENKEIERIKYLPQRFLETLCNNDDDVFENELRKVIFSHVNETDRLNQSTLSDLIDLRTKTKQTDIELLVSELAGINKKIVESEKMLALDYKQVTEEKMKALQYELELHLKTKPEEILNIDHNPEVQSKMDIISNQLMLLNEEHAKLVKEIESSEEEYKNIKENLATIERLEGYIDNFDKQYEIFLEKCKDDAAKMDINMRQVVSLHKDSNSINIVKESCKLKHLLLTNLLEGNHEDNLHKKKEKMELDILKVRGRLDEPNRKYQVYLKDLTDWETKHTFLNKQIIKQNEEWVKLNERLPLDLQSLKENRIEKAKLIHQNIKEIAGIYKELYLPVQKFISEHPIADEEFKLNFEVSIIHKGFTEKFFEHYINQSFKGAFQARNEGKKLLQDLYDSTDFNDTESAVNFILKITGLLANKDESEPESIAIQSQVRKNIDIEEFYSFLFSFSYLQPSYSLKLGTKELSKLSPGEKGALLLIFYLLVDNDQIPLVIDQPEENLDNQTVFKLLVPCIKEAKNRRQIIIVTHNPNLAVVCDAEQIIYSNMNKVSNNQITYKSGAIENPEINKKIIDVLEGTTPAFKKRDAKYLIGSGV
jgi:AAA domain, putative AbiEii toxin, Type IV TA system